MAYQNPDASKPLMVPVLVVCNTSDEILERNIRINSARDLEWLKYHEPHDGEAIIVGGGPSLTENLDQIKVLKDLGGTVFAMNGVSQFLRSKGIQPHYQCIIDAKEETASLVDVLADNHLFGSQVDPKTMNMVERPTVWHLALDGIEELFPPGRVKRGGYVLLGGGAAVGNSSMCAAYALGYRKLHVFGLDSCHREGHSHAYAQPMNDWIPLVHVEWAGKKFLCSVAMKAQAERFQITSQFLKELGCEIDVYGEGLLQTMYHAKEEDLSEREKYQLMWNYDAYRVNSPGEGIVDLFLEVARPDSLIVDYGCGTGRAGVKMHEAGHEVLLIDFADNCRDDKAQALPFIQWDLTKPCPASSHYGFCTDVMEHIPPKDVETVIDNIMASSRTVFFQISTEEDHMGIYIDKTLHLTVKPHSWWKELFEKNYNVTWEREEPHTALFLIQRRFDD